MQNSVPHTIQNEQGNTAPRLGKDPRTVGRYSLSRLLSFTFRTPLVAFIQKLFEDGLSASDQSYQGPFRVGRTFTPRDTEGNKLTSASVSAPTQRLAREHKAHPLVQAPQGLLSAHPQIVLADGTRHTHQGRL